MYDNDYLASLACSWKNLVKLKFLVWFSCLVRHVPSSTSDPVEDLNFSSGSRGGAREALPLYLKTKLGPEGPKKIFFWRPGSSPLISGSGWPSPAPPFLIWKSSSATELHLRRPKLQISVWFLSWTWVRSLRQAFKLTETWMFIWPFIRILNRRTFTSCTSLSDSFHFLLAKCVIMCGVDRTWGRLSASVNYERFHVTNESWSRHNLPLHTQSRFQVH